MPMTYIRTEQAEQSPEQGSRKYTGAVAQGYDEKREKSEKWKVEQSVIENMLSDLAHGDYVLDVPCGTGRFFDFYNKQGLIIRAMDISADMIEIARKKNESEFTWFAQRNLLEGTGLDPKSVDAAVMCRMTRWLSPEECGVALHNLMTVTRKKIVFTARVRSHPHARTYEMIQGWLDTAPEKWGIYRDEPGAEDAYRIIELRPEKSNGS